MYRTRLPTLLLLLPALAACASQRPAPAPQAPIPALSVAAILDGGKTSPLQSPVIVKYAPYPPASFERLTLARETGQGKAWTSATRVAGTTFAEATGDLVTITFIIESASWTGNLPSPREGKSTIKGAKLTLLVPPYGPVSKATASLPSSRNTPIEAAAAEKRLINEFSNQIGLPPTGFHQSDVIKISEAYPAKAGDGPDSFDGKATVQGLGFYRGRPVILFDITGVGTVKGQPIGMHAYQFLDTATGIWSHIELLAEGTLTINGDRSTTRLRIIDDVQF